jgi:hypothetical protein
MSSVQTVNLTTFINSTHIQYYYCTVVIYKKSSCLTDTRRSCVIYAYAVQQQNHTSATSLINNVQSSNVEIGQEDANVGLF